MNWVLIFLGFSLLIILHEAGHFFAAKATGMRVERFFLFFPPKLVSIKRGENYGREITYYNVVRQMVPIGSWRGEPMDKELPKSDLMEGYDGCTAILQVNGVGEILGAAQYQEE